MLFKYRMRMCKNRLHFKQENSSSPDLIEYIFGISGWPHNTCQESFIPKKSALCLLRWLQVQYVPLVSVTHSGRLRLTVGSLRHINTRFTFTKILIILPTLHYSPKIPSSIHLCAFECYMIPTYLLIPSACMRTFVQANLPDLLPNLMTYHAVHIFLPYSGVIMGPSSGENLN